MDCRLTSFKTLQREAFRFLRRHDATSPWPATAVPLEHEQFFPSVPDYLGALGESWRRVRIPELNWTVGLGYDVESPDRCSHLHADLAEHGVHLDLFRFVSWGPFRGVTGLLISQDEILAAGGEWGQPPAGGRRNWPLGAVLPTGALLTVSGTIPVVARLQSQIEVAVWERDG